MLSVILLITIISSILWRLKYTVPKFGKRLPGPPVIPLIGCSMIPNLWTKKKNYEMFEDLCDKYGPVIGLMGGNHQFVIVRDFKIARELMNSEEWAARNRGINFIMERSFNKNLGLIWSHGDSWKEIRRYSTKMMKKYGFGKFSTIDVFLEAELSDFLRCFDLEKGKNNDIVNVFQLFNVSALNMTWSLVAGIRFSYEDANFKKFIFNMDAMLKAVVPGISLMTVAPYLRYIPNLTEHTAILRVHRELQLMFKEFLDGRRAKGTYKNNPIDFIDIFLKDIDSQPLEKRDTRDPNNNFTDEQLIMVCLDLFFASADTTSSVLEFSLLYMLLNPRVYEKVRAEIDLIIGSKRPPNLSDKEKMPYVEATIQEVLRCGSINPLAARSSDKDQLIDGYFVPKETVVGILLHSFNMDKDTWGDPECFRPERFLDENNHLIKYDKLMPFGFGKRVCIGEHLARSTVFVFFTTLIQRYNIEKVSNTPELTTYPRTGITSTPQPFKMIAKSKILNYSFA